MVYDRDCPIEIFVVDEELIERVGHPVSSSEVMLVKILVKVRTSKTLTNFNLKLCREMMKDQIL